MELLKADNLKKGDEVAIVQHSSLGFSGLISYVVGTVTEVSSKQITVETNEFELFFSADGTEKKRGKNRLYSLDAINNHNNALQDAKEDYRNDLAKSIDELLENASTLRLEKALKVLRGE
jgi:preprotein translocase subunit YajC